MAARDPQRLFIGVDASADGLREVSRRVAGKPAKGGLPNALFGRLSLEDAPGELAGIADSLTVLLPWGSLLRAVALPDPRELTALRALGKPGATFFTVFGYSAKTDGASVGALGVPALDDPAIAGALERSYRDAGLAVTARAANRDEVRALPTTWAQRLAFASADRRFLALRGQIA
jgi:16S rRNA (adenine(1408)-N(1))-methyltransferase